MKHRFFVIHLTRGGELKTHDYKTEAHARMYWGRITNPEKCSLIWGMLLTVYNENDRVIDPLGPSPLSVVLETKGEML